MQTTDPYQDWLDVYAREYDAGECTLGGNLAGGGAGAETNYVVLVSQGVSPSVRECDVAVVVEYDPSVLGLGFQWQKIIRDVVWVTVAEVGFYRLDGALVPSALTDDNRGDAISTVRSDWLNRAYPTVVGQPGVDVAPELVAGAYDIVFEVESGDPNAATAILTPMFGGGDAIEMAMSSTVANPGEFVAAENHGFPAPVVISITPSPASLSPGDQVELLLTVDPADGAVPRLGYVASDSPILITSRTMRGLLSTDPGPPETLTITGLSVGWVPLADASGVLMEYDPADDTFKSADGQYWAEVVDTTSYGDTARDSIVVDLTASGVGLTTTRLWCVEVGVDSLTWVIGEFTSGAVPASPTPPEMNVAGFTARIQNPQETSDTLTVPLVGITSDGGEVSLSSIQLNRIADGLYESPVLYAVRELADLDGDEQAALPEVVFIRGKGSTFVAFSLYYVIAALGDIKGPNWAAFDSIGRHGISQDDWKKISDKAAKYMDFPENEANTFTHVEPAVTSATKSQILKAFELMDNDDVFVYVGHGSNENLIGWDYVLDDSISKDEIDAKLEDGQAPLVVFLYSCGEMDVRVPHPHRNPLRDMFFAKGTKVFIGATGKMPAAAAKLVVSAFWNALLTEEKTFWYAEDKANKALYDWCKASETQWADNAKAGHVGMPRHIECYGNFVSPYNGPPNWEWKDDGVTDPDHDQDKDGEKNYTLDSLIYWASKE